MLRTEDSSTLTSVAPANGGRTLRACTMPGSLTPTAHFTDPSTFPGMSPQRYDIPAKVDGSLKWAVDVKLPGHGARAQRQAAGRRRDARQHRRIVRAQHARLRQGRQQGQLRRRRLRARRAGDRGRAAAQGQLAEAGDARRSRRRRICSTTCAARRRRPAQPPVVVGNPDAALAGAAKVVEAEYDVPFQGHTAIGPAHAMADPSNGQMTIYSNDMKSYGMRNGVAQFLDMPRDRVRVVWMDGPQALRPHGRRRCRVRGGVPGEGDRPAGARAVDAAGRNGVGHEGPGVRVQDARRPRRAGQPRRARLRRARRRSQPSRLQRARHRADRAAHGPARSDAGARQRGDAVGHVRHPEPAHRRSTSSACRWSGRRRCAPATCAIPNGPQIDVRRPSRSSTSSRRRRRPIRSSSG